MARARNRNPIQSNFSLEAFMDKIKAAGADDAFVQSLGARLKGFADDYATHLQEQIDTKGIGVSGDLKKYLYGRSVMFQDGNAKAGVKFNVYGIFVNLGVGKGLMATEQQIGRGLTSSRAANVKRTPKPWLTDGTNNYSIKLTELLEGDGAAILERVIAEELEKGYKAVRVVV